MTKLETKDDEMFEVEQRSLSLEGEIKNVNLGRQGDMAMRGARGMPLQRGAPTRGRGAPPLAIHKQAPRAPVEGG
jgi:hypothetical protein